MEVEYDIHIVLPVVGGKVYKKDLRNALNLSPSHYLRSIHLMMRGKPDFKTIYEPYHKTAQAIPITLAIQIAQHLYDEGKVTIKIE